MSKGKTKKVLPVSAFKGNRVEWNKQFWDTSNKWAVENARAVGNY